MPTLTQIHVKPTHDPTYAPLSPLNPHPSMERTVAYMDVSMAKMTALQKRQQSQLQKMRHRATNRDYHQRSSDDVVLGAKPPHRSSTEDNVLAASLANGNQIANATDAVWSYMHNTDTTSTNGEWLRVN